MITLAVLVILIILEILFGIIYAIVGFGWLFGLLLIGDITLAVWIIIRLFKKF